MQSGSFIAKSRRKWTSLSRRADIENGAHIYFCWPLSREPGDCAGCKVGGVRVSEADAKGPAGSASHDITAKPGPPGNTTGRRTAERAASSMGKQSSSLLRGQARRSRATRPRRAAKLNSNTQRILILRMTYSAYPGALENINHSKVCNTVGDEEKRL